MQLFNFVDQLKTILPWGKKWAEKSFFNHRIALELNRGTLYIDTAVPYELYNTVPELKIPVDKIASMFSNGVFKLRKTGTEEIVDLPADWENLLNKPNLLQAQNPFLNQYIRQLIIYGNQFIYKNQPSKLSVPKAIVNISAARLSPVMTGKEFDQVDMAGIVKEYECLENGVFRKFEPDQVLWSKIADLDSNVQGCSPIKAMKFLLTNNKLAYQYFNVISSEKGNIGILSSGGNVDKLGGGVVPMSPKEKEDLEKLYRQENGIEDNQKKIHITTGTVTWQPMTYPTKDLLLQEQLDNNFLRILWILGVNQHLFSSSTYENVKEGLISTHENVIVPYADGFTQAIEQWLCDGGKIKNGHDLIIDYSHLPYLQKNKKEGAETFASASNALSSLVSSGIINAAQANAILVNQFGVKIK